MRRVLFSVVAMSMLLMVFTGCKNDNGVRDPYNRGSRNYEPPTANFQGKIVQPLSVVLNNTSVNATSYEWDFGDGNTSREESPTHRYSSAGTYLITLWAKNAAGSSECHKTAEISVPRVYVKGIQYNTIGKVDKYYKSVCKDDDFFTTTWWNTTYTPILNSSKLPYQFIFATAKELSGLDEDDYYTVYVYWNNSSSGDGTQIMKQNMYTSSIMKYPESITLQNDNKDTSVSILFEYK